MKQQTGLCVARTARRNEITLMPSKVWLFLAAVLAAVAGFVVSQQMQPRADAMRSGTLLPVPREIPDFGLVAEDGQAFTKAQLQGHWNLLFVGFTHCPDVCPTTLSLLKRVMTRLGPGGDNLQVVFLSVDPERDTPQKLKAYAQYFNPRFRGVTGLNAELDKLGASLGFVYVKVPGATPESYNIDHSSALMLVNPQGQLAGFFMPPFSEEDLSYDLENLVHTAL
jgi:protein SCO1/2